MLIYNTLTRAKEEFKANKHVKIMVCGPTLYDYMHLGHARLFIVLDTLARYLAYEGYKPKVLIILTDIDPKVFRRAEEEDVDYKVIVDRFKEEFEHDLRLLNFDHKNLLGFALASDYSSIACKNIIKLIKQGNAYMNKGNVYFDTSSIQSYAKLSRLSKDELLAKPIDLIADKRNDHDFMIWNGRDDLLYSIKDSYLNEGMPWWHVQDASIASANFGSYDIHIGARELIYPHHDALLALYDSLSIKVRYWVHVGLLMVNDTKMGKSKNNIIRVRDAIERYGLNALRLYILSKHYRYDMEFDEQELIRFKGVADNLKMDDSNLIHMLADDLNTSIKDDRIDKDLANILGLRV